MASTVELDEDYFQCSICSDDFLDPRSLPCLHSFCRSCLSDHITTSALDSPPSFLCPICRALTLVPAAGKPKVDWAGEFPGNFILKNLMSQRKTLVNTESVSECLVHPGQRLTQQNDLRQMKGGVYRLNNLISKVEVSRKNIENEIAYRKRQKEKATNAIENHAAGFLAMIDRAKRRVLGELNTEFQSQISEIDKVLAKNNTRLNDLITLRDTAENSIHTEENNSTINGKDILQTIEDALSTTETDDGQEFQRMRITFLPDYSGLKQDFNLGSVSFYNARVLSVSDSQRDPGVFLTRSLSSSEGFSEAPSATMRRPLSTSALQSYNSEGSPQISRPGENPQIRQRPVSAPWTHMQRGEIGKLTSNIGVVQSDISRNLPAHDVEADPRISFVDLPITGNRHLSEQSDTVSSESPTSSTPVFTCGGGQLPRLGVGLDPSTWDLAVKTTAGTKVKQDVPEPVDEGCDGINPEILERFSLQCDDDQSLPIITGTCAMNNGSIISADVANKSIKMFQNAKCMSSIKLEHKPQGMAVASEERVLVSSPDARQLLVIRIGEKELSLINTFSVLKAYTRLAHYRPGIIAALSVDNGCIDLVNLQGKTMKTFTIFEDQRSDIPFCVNSKQEIVIWDSFSSSFMVVNKSGAKRPFGSSQSVTIHDIRGLTCDAGGVLYVICGQKVCIVSGNGKVKVIQNVYSCDALFWSSNQNLWVVETGGGCKILKMS